MRAEHTLWALGAKHNLSISSQHLKKLPFETTNNTEEAFYLSGAQQTMAADNAEELIATNAAVSMGIELFEKVLHDKAVVPHVPAYFFQHFHLRPACFTVSEETFC